MPDDASTGIARLIVFSHGVFKETRLVKVDHIYPRIFLKSNAAVYAKETDSKGL